MLHQETQSQFADIGTSPDTLSNEVLKLKIDDLFQEIEGLKRRIDCLEHRDRRTEDDRPARIRPSGAVFNDLERFLEG